MNNIPIDSFYVQWHILDRCNLRCMHCYQDDFSNNREPDWERLKENADNLLETMAAWGVKLDAALTGGEPFLKPELFQLLQYLDQSPQVGTLSVISNGTILPDYAQELAKLPKMKEIRISLDGVTPETNDGIRGKHTLAKVLDNIAAWKRLGLPVVIMFTVMKQNRHEIGSLLDFGRKHGVSGIIIERFFPIGQGSAGDTDILNGEEFLEIWRELLEQIGVSAEPEELSPYRAIRIDFEGDDGDEVDVLGSGCVVAKDGMALLPEGSVLPCRRFPLAVGNLNEDSLETIWKESPVLAALKDKSNLKGKCGTCDITECRGCRAMCYVLENDFLARDPHCWVY